MPIEQRVISGPKIGAKIGSPAGGANESKSEPEGRKRRGRPRKRLLWIVGVLVLAGAAAAWWFLLRGDGAPTSEPAPEPGAVVQVDPISLNLADGHYLRLGIALQLTKDTAETPDTARALDAAIAVFSGRTVAEVADPATRDQLTDQLAAKLADLYEGEVMDVYLTNYVTQ